MILSKYIWNFTIIIMILCRHPQNKCFYTLSLGNIDILCADILMYFHLWLILMLIFLDWERKNISIPGDGWVFPLINTSLKGAVLLWYINLVVQMLKIIDRFKKGNRLYFLLAKQSILNKQIHGLKNTFSELHYYNMWCPHQKV